MGQYYRAIIGALDAKKVSECTVFHPFSVFDEKGEDCGSGMKLLEHSWMGNWFVLGVEENLYRNPLRVAWVGDYADAEMSGAVLNAAKAKFEPFENAWGKNVSIKKIVHNDAFSLAGKFLVNHDKKVFIDLDDYAERCGDADGWQIDPLPILTAIGNGEGGGDYFGDSDADKVGTWAWNVLSIEDSAPDGFEAFSPTFLDR